MTRDHLGGHPAPGTTLADLPKAPVGPGPGQPSIPGRVDLWQTVEQLRAAFCRDTSELPDQWSPENPSVGQCHVSALLLQRLFGGHIVYGWAFVQTWIRRG